MHRGLYPKPSDRGLRGACGLSTAANGLGKKSADAVYGTMSTKKLREPRFEKKQKQEDGWYIPKINHHTLERPTSNTSSPVSSRLQPIAIMLHLLTLSTHTRVAAIENRASLWAGCPSSPIPVWLCTIVATLDSQRALIRKREVAMPGEEVSRAVDGERVFHVYGDEVVESGFGARVHGRELGRRFGYALHGGDVGAFFRGADAAPGRNTLAGGGVWKSVGGGFGHTILGVPGVCLWYMLLSWQWRCRWLLGLWSANRQLHLRHRVRVVGTVRRGGHTALRG